MKILELFGNEKLSEIEYHLDTAHTAPDEGGMLRSLTFLTTMADMLNKLKDPSLDYPTPSTGVIDSLKKFVRNITSEPLTLTLTTSTPLTLNEGKMHEYASIFDFLSGFIQNTAKNSDKNIEVYIPSSAFGYFEYVAKFVEEETHNVKVIRLEANNADLKLTAKDFDKIDTKEEAKRILVWHNPVNPTQAVYTKSEVEALSKVVDKKFNVIFEDLTMAPLYEGGSRSFFRKHRGSFADSDLGKLRQEFSESTPKEKLGFFTEFLKDKTILAMSTAKALAADSRVSGVYVPHTVGYEVSKMANDGFNRSEHRDLVALNVLKNPNPIVEQHIASYEARQMMISDEVEDFNRLCSFKFGVKPIKLTPPQWQAGNVLNIDVTDLHPILIKQGVIDKIYEDLKTKKLIPQDSKPNENPEADMYLFFRCHLKAQMVPGSMNNMGNERIYFRLPLGGSEQGDFIKSMFADLGRFVCSIKCKEKDKNSINVDIRNVVCTPNVIGKAKDDSVVLPKRPPSVIPTLQYLNMNKTINQYEQAIKRTPRTFSKLSI